MRKRLALTPTLLLLAVMLLGAAQMAVADPDDNGSGPPPGGPVGGLPYVQGQAGDEAGSWITRFAERILGIQSGYETGCAPPPYDELASETSDQLAEDFERNERSSPCDGFADAYSIAHRPEARDHALGWMTDGVAELNLAHDYRNAVIQALSALSEFKAGPAGSGGDSMTAELRWQAAEAVFLAAKSLGPMRDPAWLDFALGISTGTAMQASARYLALQAFIDDYPSSPHVAQAQAMAGEMMDMMIDREIRIAKHEDLEEEYFDAIGQLESLYAIPAFAGSARAPEVVFLVVKSELAFARDIAHPPWINLYRRNGIVVPQWPLKRLQDVFHDLALARNPPEDPSSLTQDEIIVYLRNSASQMAATLGQLDPSGKWAAQADSFVEKARW